MSCLHEGNCTPETLAQSTLPQTGSLNYVTDIPHIILSLFTALKPTKELSGRGYGLHINEKNQQGT